MAENCVLVLNIRNILSLVVLIVKTEEDHLFVSAIKNIE